MMMRIGVLHAIGFCLVTAVANAQIVNFEKSESLDAALKSDPAYASDRTAASRAVAARSYLEYLQKATDSGQRAKVYFNLGHMYCVGARPQRDEPKDTQKAKEYFEAVLKESPSGICRETLWARTMLASLAPTMEERVDLEMKTYKFLGKIDQEYLAAHLILPQPLPEIPEQAATPDREAIEIRKKWEVEVASNYCKTLVADTSNNVVECAISEALACKLPQPALNKIIQDLPAGDKLRERAVGALRDLTQAILKEPVKSNIKRIDQIPDSIDAKGIEQGGPGQVAAVPHIPIDAPIAVSNTSHAWFNILVVAGIVMTVAAVACCAIMWEKRRRVVCNREHR